MQESDPAPWNHHRMGIPFAQTWRAQAEQRARPLWASLFDDQFRAELEWQDGNDLDRIHGVDAYADLHTGQRITVQCKALSAEYAHHGTITIEDFSECASGNWKAGDWDNCIAELYAVGYINEAGDAFSDYVIVDAARLKLATSFGAVRWQTSRNTRDGAQASFKFAKVADLPESCVLAREGFGLPAIRFKP